MSASIRNATKAVALTMPFLFLPTTSKAEKFTAGVVMQKMGSEERYAYVAGVVEGFAISRYLQDGKKPDGMNCIYDWFYKDTKAVETIYAAFGRFPDFPPGSIIEALTRKACSP